MCYVQLRRLQYIHSRNFIHHDLKPSNIVMGVGDQTNLVYLIDFGLSKEYRDPNTCTHIPYNEGVGFIGTTTFASINSHKGLELGRRDDLESLAYVLFYFLWGFLPWQGLRKGEAIQESKRTITTHDLFLRLPVEFQTFFEHCRSLSFDDKPNYDNFYDLFGNLILREGFQPDTAFDWDVAGGKNQQGCTDKSEALQHKRDHSPKRVPR
jgi:serine/threonine protein kinase